MMSMDYWMVYERCEGCTQDCLVCKREDRHLTLRMVVAEDTPANALYGPYDDPERMLKRISDHFDFDRETGRIFFKVRVRDE